MKKALILTVIAILLCFSVVAQTQDIYKITLDIKDGKATIVSRELTKGYAPQVYEGGTFTVKGGKQVSGNFDYPNFVVMEKFQEDGGIEGTAKPFEGKKIIFVPASSDAQEVELRDPQGGLIGAVDVRGLKSSVVDQEELSGSSDFFERYTYLVIIGGVLIGLILLILLVIRLFRKKK